MLSPRWRCALPFLLATPASQVPSFASWGLLPGKCLMCVWARVHISPWHGIRREKNTRLKEQRGTGSTVCSSLNQSICLHFFFFFPSHWSNGQSCHKMKRRKKITANLGLSQLCSYCWKVVIMMVCGVSRAQEEEEEEEEESGYRRTETGEERQENQRAKKKKMIGTNILRKGLKSERKTWLTKQSAREYGKANSGSRMRDGIMRENRRTRWRQQSPNTQAEGCRCHMLVFVANLPKTYRW